MKCTTRFLLGIVCVACLIACKAMTDPRDGKTYKTVTIGTQTWMAENLNYRTYDSYCYDDKTSNCSKYGRLYTWDAAMRACPSGWHLPTIEEFKTLIDAVGGEKIAGTKLKSTTGWVEDGNGTDDFGFSAFPAGYRDINGKFNSSGYSADFWSATEDNSYSAYSMSLNYYVDYAYLYYIDGDADLGSSLKNYAHSVRCLRD